MCKLNIFVKISFFFAEGICPLLRLPHALFIPEHLFPVTIRSMVKNLRNSRPASLELIVTEGGMYLFARESGTPYYSMCNSRPTNSNLMVTEHYACL